uniref:Cytochrome P450 n=1 Tax=Aegilops tauschii subsp. strangulata TaxID=200361 RepID=A0A453DJ14_AEGTS
ALAAFLQLLLLPLLSLAAVFLLHARASWRLHKGAAPYPLLGHLPQFLANRHRILDWVTEVLARQPTCTLVFHRPGGVAFHNYPKGPRFASALHDFLGRGILNVDGHAWRAQRKAASYEFNTRSLRLFVARTVHRELHGRLLPLLRRAAGSGCRLDLQDTLERYAFDNICRVAFDHDPRQLPDGDAAESAATKSTASSRFADAFRDAANLSAGRFRYAVPGLWKIKKALNLGSERRLRESIAVVHGFADGIIRSRREEMRMGCEKHDLLSRFMLLSSRPDVERRIRDEVAAVRARRAISDLNRPGFDLDELREMHYVCTRPSRSRCGCTRRCR